MLKRKIDRKINQKITAGKENHEKRNGKIKYKETSRANKKNKNKKDQNPKLFVV
jgi:hypothetical protein